MVSKRLIPHVFFMLILSSALSAQVAPGKYWVHFSDKSNTPYSLNAPEQFLSSESIERRLRFDLGFDWFDLPVDPVYVSQVLDLGNCTLHNRSKWFNAITIEVIDTALTDELISALQQLPFVFEVRSVAALASGNSVIPEKEKTPDTGNSDTYKRGTITDGDPFPQYRSGGDFSYGPSLRQIEMINGHLLHEQGYTGGGMDIAVLDGGWIFVDLLPAFEHVRNEGRIIDTYDFVNVQHPNVYSSSSHGTFVLSHICGIIEDSLVGTAPDADFYLYRTENVSSEYRIEEDNWVAAAERCDSLGIDIINSSLGYSTFDDSLTDHSYADMNGHTTRSSIAADLAAAKGILVVNSAGNEGVGDWHFITAPSDGDSVLCIGAVDSEGNHASFSSYGPSSDGDIKPNVVVMGRSTVFADLDSTIRMGSGTSFSSPVLAGAAACLWQAFPLCSNMDIFHAIEQSASLYSTPNDSMGYGIPDMWKAYKILQEKVERPLGTEDIALFPNPANDFINVRIRKEDSSDLHYEIIDVSGKVIFSPVTIAADDMGPVVNVGVNLGTLASGWYIFRLKMNDKFYNVPFQKVNN